MPRNYGENKRKGICVQCGVRRAVKDITRCEKCRVKLNSYTRKLTLKKTPRIRQPNEIADEEYEKMFLNSE